MVNISKIKSCISDFKEWVYVWHPIRYEHELMTIKSSGEPMLNFPELRGKRFVSKEIKKWNELHQRLVEFCLPRFERRYGKPQYVRTYYMGWHVSVDISIIAPELNVREDKSIDFDFRQLPNGFYELYEQEPRWITGGGSFLVSRIYQLPEGFLFSALL